MEQVSAATYSGGSGTSADPYRISSTANWTTLTSTLSDWNKHFILTIDLNFNGATVTPVGNLNTNFTGVFNGNGHVLRNARISWPTSIGVGIFGVVAESGQIRSLGIEQVNITGDSSVGGLAGINTGFITSCYSTGVITGNSTVGGLIGDHDVGILSNCYSWCSVNGTSCVGGLLGDTYEGSLINCYSTGAVSGTQYVYGLAERSSAFCFWDIQTSGQIKSGGGIGLPTAAMKNAQTFLKAFWDFKGEIANGTNDYWTMPAGGGYPILAWQVNTSSAPTNDEMSNAMAITAGSSLAGSSANTTGVDLTANGYNDWADVWYYFDCASSDKYTVSVTSLNFDTTASVFDEGQREVVFNDDSFGGKSTVILKAISGNRYYIRVSGHNGAKGNFTLSVQQGAVAAIQGDLNYDGNVNLVDFSVMAENWMMGG